MGKARKIGRRAFLAASAAAAGPLVLGRRVHGQTQERKTSANDKVRVGCIGVGRRGRQIMGLPEDAQIVAISDVNRNRLEEVAAGKDWRTYQDYREMLACDDIDAVIVATPDHWHALNVVHACEAGKDVYVEKPMSLTVREGQAMVAAARKHERIVQVGSQQRSMGACRFGCELVRNGRLGEITVVHAANYPSPWECELPAQPVPEGLDWDVWCGPTEPRPYHIDLYLPRAQGRADAQGRRLGWISFRPYSGGEMTGWGAHGLDIIQWALGAEDSGPVEVWPEGEGLTCPVTMRYASGVLLKLDGKGPEGGGLFEGTEGTLLIDRGKYEATPPVLAEELPASAIRLYKSEDHLKNWIDCIRSRELPVADVAIGHRSTNVCHLGNIARWIGRGLRWDPAKEQFIGDDEANALLERSMRASFALPPISSA